MNAAHIDPDRLVVLASAADSGSTEESAHLSLCAECRIELGLVRAARRLGVTTVPPIDWERVMASVRARQAEPPAPAPRRRPLMWLVGIAAAAVLLMVRFGTPDTGPGPGRAVPVAAATPGLLHELDDLSVPELEAVLSTLPSSAEGMSHLEALNDLNTSDLERVLRSMEE